MSQLVSRILLAVLMLPAAAMIYLVTYVAADRTFGYASRPMQSLVSGLSAWIFVGIYWYGLWHGSVRWTRQRITRTILAAAGAAVIGFLAAIFIGAVEREVGEFVGCTTAPLAWLILVTVLWRETPRERTTRMKSTDKTAVTCPSCGYNLAGLQSTRCPECGTLYTLDELFLGQPQQTAEVIQ